MSILKAIRKQTIQNTANAYKEKIKDAFLMGEPVDMDDPNEVLLAVIAWVQQTATIQIKHDLDFLIQ